MQKEVIVYDSAWDNCRTLMKQTDGKQHQIFEGVTIAQEYYLLDLIRPGDYGIRCCNWWVVCLLLNSSDLDFRLFWLFEFNFKAWGKFFETNWTKVVSVWILGICPWLGSYWIIFKINFGSDLLLLWCSSRIISATIITSSIISPYIVVECQLIGRQIYLLIFVTSICYF